MKRLIAVIAALLLAGTAAAQDYATVALIRPRGPIGTDSPNLDGIGFQRRNFEAEQQVMKRLGIHYEIVHTAGVGGIPTEQVRLGTFYGPAGVTTYDGVVIPHAVGGANTTAMYGARYDSLFRVARGGMVKPSLWIVDNVSVVTYATTITATACSTGATARAENTIGLAASLDAEPSKRFLPGPFASGYVIDPDIAGGVRVHLRQSTPAGAIIPNYTAFNANWADSLPFINSATEDTALVWERLWDIATLPDAKPMVFATFCGSGGFPDSVTTATNLRTLPSEGSYDLLVCGFARLDSIIYAETGKRLITKPLETAFVVDGFMRNNVRGSGYGIGRDVADTTAFYGSLDSLRVWGIPFTGGVNVDSAASYARDLILMKRLGAARWTPQVWTGITDTSAAGLSGAQLKKPIDVFGHFRNRAALGDTTNAARTVESADSSVYQLLRYATYKQDSLGLRRSHTLVPPLADYSPKQCVRKDLYGLTRSDSVLYAGRLLGYSAVVVNGNMDQSRPSATVAATQVNGWRQKQGREYILGDYMNILAENSEPARYGSTKQRPTFDDAYPVGTSTVGSFDYMFHNSTVALHGLLLDGALMDKDTWQYDGQLYSSDATFFSAREVRYRAWHFDPLQWPRHGSIVRLDCDLLSGDPTNPARMGLWLMKDLWNVSRAANAMAAKPFWTWTYPEHIQP